MVSIQPHRPTRLSLVALAGSDADFGHARLAIETHLERITLHRPLEKIDDVQQRTQARQAREWFLGKFLKAQDE
jgi:hypothetical protein